MKFNYYSANKEVKSYYPLHKLKICNIKFTESKQCW